MLGDAMGFVAACGAFDWVEGSATGVAVTKMVIGVDGWQPVIATRITLTKTIEINTRKGLQFVFMRRILPCAGKTLQYATLTPLQALCYLRSCGAFHCGITGSGVARP